MEMKNDIQSSDFWIRKWHESVARTNWARKAGYTRSETWNRMAATYGGGCSKESASDKAEDLIAMLKQEGLLREGTRVLDVGCGIGRMAIPFAAHGAAVTALDFSEGMLGRMRESISSQLVSRIQTIHADWDSIDLKKNRWEHAFDLVFASMTPAIRTPESFLKLHRTSKHACYFKGWAGRSDPLLGGIWTHLMKEPMPPMGWDIILAFNLLYSMGCSPSINFTEVFWERRQSIQEAGEFFVDFFEQLTNDSEETLQKKVIKYLESIAKDGQVIRHTSGRTGTLIWKAL